MNRLLALAALPFLATPALAQTSRSAAASSLDSEFQRSDTNHDGYLSRAEVEARMAHMRVGAKEVDAVHAKRLADLFMTRADADKDGKVSAAESRALLGTVFAAYDLNHDGKIDPQEAAAARQAAARRAAPTTPR